MISLVVLSSSSISLSHTQELKLSSYEKTYAHHINLMYLPTYPVLQYYYPSLSLSLSHPRYSLSLFLFRLYKQERSLLLSPAHLFSPSLPHSITLLYSFSLSLSSSCIRHAWKSLSVVGQAWSESVSMRPRERAALKIDIQHWRRRRRQSFSLNLRWRLSRPGLRKKWKLKFKKPTYLRVQTGSTKNSFETLGKISQNIPIFNWQISITFRLLCTYGSNFWKWK